MVTGSTIDYSEMKEKVLDIVEKIYPEPLLVNMARCLELLNNDPGKAKHTKLIDETSYIQ